ncbi:MAG TPA: PAS domain-containing sensor histidine kinase [Caulobacteraceae bacterium]|jgi:two-component system nitrogen regulation sensor histidine kinase NtrY|nr:PAS domain-containing sensor histidine kinase [Caulobacteraceae bacterium]
MPASSPVSVRRSAFSSRPLIGSCYVAAAIFTAVAVFLGASPTLAGPLGPASPVVLSLLGLGMAALALPAIGVSRRLLGLLRVRAKDPGARLHLRFVFLFAMAAVAPAFIVALFFGALVTRGIDNWFNARVQTAVENSATVARSYLDEQKRFISLHLAGMAQALDAAAPTLAQSPIAFSRYLRDLASDNGFAATYLLDRDGRILARTEPEGRSTFLDPPVRAFRVADGGEVEMVGFEKADLFRAIYRLRGYPEAYLYVLRPVDPGIFRHLRLTEASLGAYRQAKLSRARIRGAFALSYLETVLLVLVGAVWLGMEAAGGIAAPVARLVQAAGRVSAGDLTARVEVGRDPEEIAALSRAFNRMTRDLQEQQQALRTAHGEAETRRQFTEAVLSGVSAGVIGLDGGGQVSTVNRQAIALLGLTEGDSEGRNLATVAPELQAIAAAVPAVEDEAESDVDITRVGESRRLRVRASRNPEGVVLTFDDITRLVAAQRNAAWRDVARRIAHEIKNPLTPIQLSAERLRRRYRSEITRDVETFDRCTETIVRQVGDIGRMVDEFSAFARMPAPTFAPNDPAELLRQAAFAQRVADPDVTVEVGESPVGVELICDGRIVSQALANVLKNAGEAIASRKAREGEVQGRIAAWLTAKGDKVEFVVEDNGVGLPIKDRDRLIEPYVTTRAKGTGLGLAIVKRILEDHGGELQLADAAHPPGARVTLSFPGSAAARPLQAPVRRVQA